MTEAGSYLSPRQEKIMSWLVFVLIVVILVGLIGTWLRLVVQSFEGVERSSFCLNKPTGRSNLRRSR